jgi:hypothetical protein
VTAQLTRAPHLARTTPFAQDVPDSAPPKRSRMVIAMLLVLGMVLTQIIGGLKDKEYIHLFPCSVLTAGLMLLTGCMSGDQARKSILW